MAYRERPDLRIDNATEGIERYKKAFGGTRRVFVVKGSGSHFGRAVQRPSPILRSAPA